MPAGTAPSERAGSRTVGIVRSGSSGATVRIVRHPEGRPLAVKTARNPRVPAAEQAKARAAIVPFFGDLLPEVLFAGVIGGVDTLITECPSTDTLADIAGSCADDIALTAWHDVVMTLRRIWAQSARPGFDPALATRKHELRLQRGLEGLDFTWRVMGLSALPWQHLVINDADYGSLSTHLDGLASVPPPAVHVACQGDPQPRNVLLAPSGRWYLVDWEWAGLHQDWRMLTSHLIGWWYVEHLLKTARGSVGSTRAAVNLAYDPPRFSALSRWIAPAAEAFRQMSSNDQWDNDLAALSLHIAMLLIREIPASAASGRRHLLAPLLGEAVRLISSTSSRPLHPLLAQLAPVPHALAYAQRPETATLPIQGITP